MPFRSSACVQAEKSERYLASLARHFARKVPVEQTDGGVHVQFDMGSCMMSVSGTCMQFECAAQNQKALQTVKYIVGSHIIKYGELRQVKVQWQDASTE